MHPRGTQKTTMTDKLTQTWEPRDIWQNEIASLYTSKTTIIIHHQEPNDDDGTTEKKQMGIGEETEKTVKEQWRRGKWSAFPSKKDSINESTTLSFEGWLRNVH